MRFSAFLLLLMATDSVLADTVYVRDTLYVPIRGGQSNEHRILHSGVRSGTRLERLDENDDTKYSKVLMESGLEGWMRTQYLVTEPIAEDQLDAANSQLASLKEQYQASLKQIDDFDTVQNKLDQTRVELQVENQELSAELNRITALAASVIAIDEENKMLKEEQTSLHRSIDSLDVANQELQNDSNQSWFLRGAGTVLMGLLFGFWVARRIYQKRSSGGWA
jgi:SH3 domain protein|tara:strand:+ start:1403 stop:2068 length:666 start_codon:yes stop_codon:yes gene_type:complete